MVRYAQKREDNRVSHAGTFQRLIGVLNQAFETLQLRVEGKKLEEIAVLIHRAMTVQARHYHNLEHVFGFVDPDNPIQTLAGLYHDIVYYQVDQGFLPEILEIISPYIQQEDHFFNICPDAPKAWQFDLVAEVFGWQRGQEISPAFGLNEFLSALVMNQQLGDFVPAGALVKMDLCIEATIPFRGPLGNGKGYLDLLEERLIDINQRWKLGMSTTEIQNSVRLAVKVANTDVENFAESDSATFLEYTWKLLPEMNASLRAGNVYTIREYRQALQRMEAFFNKVDPALVFHRYRDFPPEEEFRWMVSRAYHNIDTAWHYLRLKLLAQAFLEALAEESGGDAPLSLFMGDLPADESVRRLENYLPEVADLPLLDRATLQRALVESGRRGHPDFDLNTAPLTLYLYYSLRPAEIETALDLSGEMFSTRLAPGDFLRQMNPEVVSALALASAEMVPTRREKLLRYAQ
jgi:hypothetical protein